MRLVILKGPNVFDGRLQIESHDHILLFAPEEIGGFEG